MMILWATPSAAGPRPLLIALGLQILGTVASRSWLLSYANLSFGMLAWWLPLRRPGGPWDDLGTLGNTVKDTLGCRLGFLLIFNGFSDPILKAFWAPWTNKGVFVHACSQVSFSDEFWV